MSSVNSMHVNRITQLNRISEFVNVLPEEDDLPATYERTK